MTCLQKHEVELTGGEHLLTHETVWVLLHALLLGKREKLPGHQTQQVELLHVGLQVDTDALADENKQNKKNTVTLTTTDQKRRGDAVTVV